MKFLLKQIFFIALLFVLTLNNTAHCQVLQIEALKANGNVPIPGYVVPDALFGNNTEDIFKRFETTNGVFSGKVASMAIKRLYYPGGSIARLAHFYSGFAGNPNVYAYQINPWEDIMKEGNAVGSEYDYMQLSNFGNSIADFVQLCNTSSTDVVLSYNIFYGNVCELNDLLTYFQGHLSPSRKVDIIVLNTEVHLGSDRDLMPNILTYYEKVKPFLDYLKTQQIYPQAKVSLDAAPDNVYNVSLANQPFYDDWNDGVSQIMSSAAYSSMNLSGTINWWWYPTDPLVNVSPCGTNCNTCPTYPNTTTGPWDAGFFANGQLDAFSFTNSTVPNIAYYYKNKSIGKMNISQWGIKSPFSPAPGNNGCFIGGQPYNKAYFYGSMLQATFMTKFLMKLIDYNFVNGEFFASANYFDLASNKNDRDPIYTSTNLDPTNIADVNASVSLTLYKEILAKSRGLYWQMIQLGPLNPNVEQFYFENAGISYCVVINEGASLISLNKNVIVYYPGGGIPKLIASIKVLASADGNLWGYDHSGSPLNHPDDFAAAPATVLSFPVLNAGLYYNIPSHSITIIQLYP